MEKKLKSQTGLVRRKGSGIYYFRARVPKLLIPLLGKDVIFDSLFTTNKSEASAAVAKRRHELALELQRLQKGTSDRLGVQERMFLADEEVQAICERYLVHTLSSDDEIRLEGMSSMSSDVYKDILDGYADSIMSSVARGDTTAITTQLDSFLQQQVGLRIDHNLPSYKKLAYEFLKTEAEAIRARQARQRGENIKTPKLQIGRTSFDTLVAEWAGLAAAKPKTRKSFQATFTELAKVHPGLFVETTTKQHATQWRQRLMADGQSPGNISKKMSYLKAVFNVAVNNSWITVNPFQGLQAPADTDKKKRIPFSNEDIETIFSSAVYRGERPRGGGGEASYWVPLLSLFTGARLEELSQLRRSNVVRDETFGWFMEITDIEDGDTVKTESARRRVPMHAELQKFGFLAYIDGLKCAPDEFIFPDLKADTEGYRGGNFSKWFGRYKKTIGIVDRRKVFHSFRHNFVDACRDCSVPRETRDVVVGHANQNVSAEYGSEKYPLTPLFEAMARVQYRGIDLSHLYRMTTAET